MAILLLSAGVGLVVLGSESTFYLASGSDSGVEIFTPPRMAKWIAATLAIAGFVFALLGVRRHALVRAAACIFGLCLLAVTTHALVLNHKRGVIEELWFLYRIDRAGYDLSEGVSADWKVRARPLGIELQHRRDGQTLYIVTGYPPFGIDPTPALRTSPQITPRGEVSVTGAHTAS